MAFARNPFLCMTFPPTHSSLGCMTLSWRRPMVPRTFSKNPRKEISRASKPKTRAPPRVPRVFQGVLSRIPRVRMINSCLFFPPSQFFSRNSGVQKQSICRRGIPGTLIQKIFFSFYVLRLSIFYGETWWISNIFQGLMMSAICIVVSVWEWIISYDHAVSIHTVL